MTNETRTATVDGKTYRLADSCIPADGRFDKFRAELALRGIADHVNALPPRSRNRFVQLFIMADGTAQRASSTVLGEASRASRSV